jgi:hypothetical protein
MMVGVRTYAALLALAAVMAPACKRAEKKAPAGGDAGAARQEAPAARVPETAVVEEVAVRRVDPERAVAMEDEDIAGAVAMALAGSKAFAARPEEVPAGRTGVPARVSVTVTYDVVESPAGKSIVVAVEGALEWKQGDRLTPRQNVLVERPLGKGDEKKAAGLVVEIVQQAALEAARGLVAKEELRQGDDPAIVTGLDSKDPDAVAWSLELVAERRVAAGFDRALALLQSKDAGIRAAALRALVALKDPRAIAPLAEMADFTSNEELRTVIEAVTAIGGDEAAEFLEYVATGHSDADLRSRAQEGLERIGRRKPR